MSDRRVDSWIGAGTIVSTSLAPVDSGMVRDAGVAGVSPPGGGTSFSRSVTHLASDADDSLLARDGGWRMDARRANPPFSNIIFPIRRSTDTATLG